MRHEHKGLAAILGAALGYGTLAVLAKLALNEGAEVLPLLSWRFLVGGGLVWLMALVTRRGLPDRRSVAALIGLGLVYTGNSLLFLVGLQWVPASTASLVFFAYPAVVVLLARAVLGEPLTSRRITSLVLALTGCALTVGGGLAGGSPLGIALILGAVAMVSLFIIYSHPVMQRLPAYASAAVTLSTTAVLCASATLILNGDLSLGGTSGAMLYTVLLGIFGTAVPITLFLVGIKLIGPARAAIYSTIEPLITVILAAIVIGERLTPLQMLGGALILSAVIWLRTERPMSESELPGQLESP